MDDDRFEADRYDVHPRSALAVGLFICLLSAAFVGFLIWEVAAWCAYRTVHP